jgi:hypothetical protein
MSLKPGSAVVCGPDLASPDGRGTFADRLLLGVVQACHAPLAAPAQPHRRNESRFLPRERF